MGSVGEAPGILAGTTISNVDAKLADHIDHLTNNEPLVLDIAVMHDHQAPDEENAPFTPVTNKLSLDRPASWLLDDDDDILAPAPPDFTSRQEIHVPLRTSSITPAANRKRLSLQRRLSADVTSYSMSTTPDPYHAQVISPSRTPSSGTRRSHSTRAGSTGPTTVRSSADSVISFESVTPSIATQCLAPLQNKGNIEESDRLSPLLEDDPSSFDLVSAPEENGRRQFSLETRSEQLFSKEHLEAIFQDTASFLRLTSFLNIARPKSLPILIYYLDALKALRAIKYANAVAEALEPIEGLEFTNTPARSTINAVLEEKARQAFEVLVRDDLPAFITHVFIQIVSTSISKRVTGNLSPLLREASEGLAEVFCLTDPSRPDNPIIFASEEFHRTTQYGVSYAIGRNCRFLQGPKTSRDSVARFKAACVGGKDHSEVFLNYRRDGSPFMNLLMTAPLLDSRGQLRYYIGAQIDVSGLVKDSTHLHAFQRMLDQQDGLEDKEEPKDEFRELSEMFNHSELEAVRKHGGNMHREHLKEKDYTNGYGGGVRPRVLIHDQSMNDFARAEKPAAHADGRLTGPYKHYLLIRPAPSLRILFTSPSLRVPGILQSSFLERIGGSQRVRESLSDAFADGRRGVTAKIRWLSHAISDIESSSEEGRPRWIHCTPLLGPSGAVGVWMVVLVDDKEQSPRRLRVAPPIPYDIRGSSDAQPSSRYDLKSSLYNFDVDEDENEQGRDSQPPRVSSLPMNGVANRRARQFALDPFHAPPRSQSPGLPRSHSPGTPHSPLSPRSPLGSRVPAMQEQWAMPSPRLTAGDQYNSRAPSMESFAI